jgi:hypothetical protein
MQCYMLQVWFGLRTWSTECVIIRSIAFSRFGLVGNHCLQSAPLEHHMLQVWFSWNCSTLSPRRPYEEYKRMVLGHTHGLFIT